MSRFQIAVWIVLFSAGVLVGNVLQLHPVLAQQKQEEASAWVIQPIEKTSAHFDAYLFNPRTGEVFALAGSDKLAVKLASK